jgi:hypothetical protein
MTDTAMLGQVADSSGDRGWPLRAVDDPLSASFWAPTAPPPVAHLYAFPARHGPRRCHHLRPRRHPVALQKRAHVMFPGRCPSRKRPRLRGHLRTQAAAQSALVNVAQSRRLPRVRWLDHSPRGRRVGENADGESECWPQRATRKGCQRREGPTHVGGHLCDDRALCASERASGHDRRLGNTTSTSPTPSFARLPWGRG